MAKLFLLFVIPIFVFASVDINNASVKELTTLKGIGKKKAEAIIEYRKTHCFKNIEELTKVKGIGKKTVKKNKPNIIVGECKQK